MLVAKVVADKQYWILQEEDQKVGNIEAWNGRPVAWSVFTG